jgi:FkbM family methyltransferase
MFQISKMRLSWVWLISTLIWATEKLFFYPKLSTAYKNLYLPENVISGGVITIFDIGANKGQSIRFFKSIFPQSRIVAFEPSEKTFNSLADFVAVKSYQDVSIFQTGVGEIHGEMNFYESVLDETSTFVLPNKNSQYLKNKNRILFQKSEDAFRAITVQITTLDQFMEEKFIGHVDILKIDVEGFELEVLRGARNALANSRIRIIQLERHTDDMREDKHPVIHELLLKNGYRQTQEIKHPFGDFHEILYQLVKAPDNNL